MKERLTGAIILVVLIVLLVPELLSGPKRASAPAPAGSAPNSSEEPPLRSYTINLGDDSHSRTEAAGRNGPSMPQPSGPEQPTAQPNGETADGASNGSATKGAQADARTSPTPSGSKADGASAQRVEPATPTPTFARGATSHTQGPNPAQQTPRTANVTALAPKLRAAAQKPTASTTAPAAKTAVPVAKITKGHPPAGSSTATNSSTSSESGWAVQLGVFASRENAERLALEVRVKGFKASVSPVTSGSRKLYRVRVGPAPDRSAAQELQGRLKAAGRHGGTVVPYS